MSYHNYIGGNQGIDIESSCPYVGRVSYHNYRGRGNQGIDIESSYPYVGRAVMIIIMGGGASRELIAG